jgi:hypothetical protein
VDLALETIGSQHQDDLLDPRIDRAVAARTDCLQRELVGARETIAALKAELRRWSARDTEIERLLDKLGI